MDGGTYSMLGHVQQFRRLSSVRPCPITYRQQNKQLVQQCVYLVVRKAFNSSVSTESSHVVVLNNQGLQRC